jgi:hypothetical protein
LIFSQIILSYSAISFDTAHNVAHVLKDAGYFINIIALALSSIEYNARLRQSNYRLKEREETIRVQYERLKVVPVPPYVYYKLSYYNTTIGQPFRPLCYNLRVHRLRIY